MDYEGESPPVIPLSLLQVDGPPDRWLDTGLLDADGNAIYRENPLLAAYRVPFGAL